MASMVKRHTTRPPGRRLPLKDSITFVLEGETEASILKILCDKQEYANLKFTKPVCLCGGGYNSVKWYIERNQNTLDIVLVIADLDRAGNDSNEAANLEKVIKMLEKNKSSNNIFLTHPNIEAWLKNSFTKAIKGNIHTFLHSYKGDPDLAEKYLRKGGTYAAAKVYFLSKRLYYKKIGISKGVFDRDALGMEQSSLYYLQDYLELLNNLPQS